MQILRIKSQKKKYIDIISYFYKLKMIFKILLRLQIISKSTNKLINFIFIQIEFIHECLIKLNNYIIILC